MKNFFIISIALITGFTTCGQKVKKEDVPSSVITKFTLTYPKVEKVKWSKEKGKYEAEFELNEIETSVLYDSIGIVLEIESEINVAELPAAIKEYVKTNCNDAKIKEASKMTDGKGIVTYEAEVKGVDYVFDTSGVFIEKSEEKRHKEGKD
jgi:hypothetical protein